MAINYDFYKPAGIFDDAEVWHIRAVNNGTVETEEMIERIAHATTLTRADLKAALSALAAEATEHLREGKHVHIEGLGYLSPSIGGEVDKDKNGQLRLQQAGIKTVRFRPETALMDALQDVSFTSKHHLGTQSATIADEHLPAMLTQLSEQKGHFTAQDFRIALHLSDTTARRRLKQLIANGVIKNIGTAKYALYKYLL